MGTRKRQWVNFTEEVFNQTKRYCVSRLFEEWFQAFIHVRRRFGLDISIAKLALAAQLDLIEIGFTPKSAHPQFYEEEYLKLTLSNQVKFGNIKWNGIRFDDHGTSEVIYGIHQIVQAIIANDLKARIIGRQFVYDMNVAKHEYEQQFGPMRYVGKHLYKKTGKVIKGATLTLYDLSVTP